MYRPRLLTTLALAAGLAWLCLPPDRPAPTPDAQAPPAPRVAAPHVPSSTAVNETAPTIATAAPTDAQAQGLYLTNQRMVRVDPSVAEQVARAHGVDLLQPPGRSGFALVAGAAGALERLAHDPRVTAALPNGRTHGAYDMVYGLDIGGPLQEMQWHLPMVETYDEYDHWEYYFDHGGNRSAVVAVLDTGVAYETAVRDGIAYTQAPSLRSSTIYTPYDFINDDPYANDDHQHGTHIASVIASSGSVRGVAPRAGLMPIKVLDEHNQGHEYALVEGIWHAIDNQADILNLSLSFGVGYQPSEALQEALQAAHDAGMFLVGAAGNHAAGEVTWPAASPLVIAVGAARMEDERHRDWDVADYSNTGAGVDFLAPGGDVLQDIQRDGIPDGILAESIDPADPSRTGYWLMAGTSQAAAIVSGLAVKAVSRNIDPGYWRAEMQTATTRDAWIVQGQSGDQEYVQDRVVDPREGLGTGLARDVALRRSEAAPAPVYASLLPYLSEDDASVAARITVWDASGTPLQGSRVHATVRDERTYMVFCVTDQHGQCTVYGHSSDALEENPDAEVAWQVTVDAVEREGRLDAPLAAMSYTSEWDQAVRGIRRAKEHRSLLTWAFERGEDAELGPILDSYSVVNSGSGLASIPLGIVLTPSLFDRLGTSTRQTLTVSGRTFQVNVLDLDGSGLASIPLGLRNVRLLAMPALGWGMDGSGLASIPLGFRATDAHGDGLMVPMDGPAPSSISGTVLFRQLDRNAGWWDEGYAGGSVLSASSYTGLPTSTGVEYSGTGAGAVELDW